MGSIVRSIAYKVLHRPIEPQDFTGLGNTQKHIMWKQSLTLRMTPLKRIGVFAFSALVLAVGLLEFGHLVRYGHFPPFGLHADVVVREADYGIDGVTKLEGAHFSIL
jgi:hypothetical protein